jgi:hypothetical protein
MPFRQGTINRSITKTNENIKSEVQILVK